MFWRFMIPNQSQTLFHMGVRPKRFSSITIPTTCAFCLTNTILCRHNIYVVGFIKKSTTSSDLIASSTAKFNLSPRLTESQTTRFDNLSIRHPTGQYLCVGMFQNAHVSQSLGLKTNEKSERLGRCPSISTPQSWSYNSRLDNLLFVQTTFTPALPSELSMQTICIDHAALVLC